MQLLKDRIVSEGHVIGDTIVKVDKFLNHQLDIDLMNQMGREFHRRFADSGVNKIITVEASGIAIAAITAQYFKVPVVFAKKTLSVNLDGAMYHAPVHSYTKNKTYDVIVAKRFLSSEDRLLIIDDFLAEGNACLGLLKIIQQAGAQVAGIGIAIEKGFQIGGKTLREQGYPLHSLAIIERMSERDGIVFRE